MGFGVNLATIQGYVTTAHITTNALVATVDAVADLVKVATDKQAGESPGKSSVQGNWQSGTATSTETGADLVSIGVAATQRNFTP